MSCICVLGMHRSGTSCLTGIMQNFGVELGDVFTENLYNKRGNRENGRIVALNDAVLATNSGAWNNPVVVTKWSTQQKAERDQIIRELQAKASPHWGFKDPRTLFTLPFWMETIETPLFIGTFRHPHQVARSLHNRDRTPFEFGWNLWYLYNKRLLELAQQYGFALADFDLATDIYLDDALHKLIELGLDAGLAPKARQFFDPQLRNQDGSGNGEVTLPTAVMDLYRKLKDYASR